MRLTTSSCRLGGTILARMKQWQLSGSTAGCATGLPAFGDGPALCRKRSRWSTRPVCRLPRQSNSDKTHLATAFLIPSVELRLANFRRKRLDRKLQDSEASADLYAIASTTIQIQYCCSAQDKKVHNFDKSVASSSDPQTAKNRSA